MGRIYRVPFNGTLTNSGGNADLLSIQPADDKPCRLVGWIFGQTSELGDTAEESLRISVIYFPATVSIGSGGSPVTPVACDPATDPAAGFTARCNDTTVTTTSGSASTMEELAWNIRNSPWERWIPEEMRPRVGQATALVVRMESTPTDDIAASLVFFVEEL
jgi:hypothetical protein